MASKESSEIQQDVARLRELLLQRATEPDGKAFTNLAKVLRRCDEDKLVQTYSQTAEYMETHRSKFPEHTVVQVSTAAYCVAAGYSEPRLVEVEREETGFGFNIMGGNSRGMPIYVSRILPTGAADKQGLLKKGDQILAVNGQAVRGLSHEDMVKLMKNTSKTVQLIVTYAPHLLDDVEKTFETQRRMSAKRRSLQKRTSQMSNS